MAIFYYYVVVQAIMPDVWVTKHEPYECFKWWEQNEDVKI